MADPVTPPTPPVTPPAGGDTPPTPPAPPAPDASKIEKAEYEKLKTEYAEYKKQVNPVLETLWSDKELLEKATLAHNKRLGKVPVTPVSPTTPEAPKGDPDVRNSQINIISTSFEDKVGISKLSSKEQADVRGAVGQMLKAMLDPKDNKTIAQVFEEVSLTKLPWYLERAYDLVTKDSQIKSAEERGKNQILQQYEGDRGSIGSMAGGSVPIDQMILSPQEKEVARKQGIAEADYLAEKKKIAASKN
jgi:hypothetical protein